MTINDTYGSTTPLNYLGLGKHWQGGYWRTTLGVVFVLATYYTLVNVLYFGLDAFFPRYYYEFSYNYWNGKNSWNQKSVPQGVFEYVVSLLVIATASISIMLGMVLIHKRPILRLLTVSLKFNWSMLLKSLVTFVAIWAVVFFVSMAFTDRVQSVRIEPSVFILFLSITCVLVPLQVLGEELFFRGYLMQILGRYIPFRIVVLLGPAILFAIAHVNNPNPPFDDVWAMATYLIYGLYFGLLVIKTNGLESSIGTHIGASMVALVLVSSGAFRNLTPTLYYVESPSTLEIFCSLSLVCAVHYMCLFKLPAIWKNLHR